MSAEHHLIVPQRGSGRIVTLDGRIKLILLAVALGVNLSAGGVRAPLLLGLIAFVSTQLAQVRAATFFKRMAIPALLALVACCTQLFWIKQGEVLLSLSFGDFAFTAYAGGLWRGAELAARILGGMSVLLFCSLTTPLPELMRAARFFRTPPVLVELALIMYRYIFLLLEEGGRIRNAQRSRLGYVAFRNGLHSSGILGGMLILRTYDRAERSFAAMRCRGYRGALTAVQPGVLHGHDWRGLLLGLILLTAVYAVR